MKTKNFERVYDRTKTCFGKWREDTPASLQQVVKEDLKFWKIQRRLVPMCPDCAPVLFDLDLSTAEEI